MMMNKDMRLSLNSLLLNCVLAISLFCYIEQTQAAQLLPDIDKKYVSIKADDPSRDAGYVVGDVLERTLTLTLKKPYQLVQESLPIVGYEHRWRGQKSGVELVKINSAEEDNADSVTYIINLAYQVFTTNRVAKPAALRAEALRIRNTKTGKLWQYKVPSFNFRISPLSVYGAVKLDQEMYPFTPPLTLDNSKQILNIKVLAGILAISLLGLLYILGSQAWLPRMGAPFAKAYRAIKKLSDTPEDIQTAVTLVHQALNKTAGVTVFNNNLNTLIASKPAFAPAKKEIEQFFHLSQEVFFEEGKHITTPNPKDWLMQLCLQLRHCERGLTPDIAQEKLG